MSESLIQIFGYEVARDAIALQHAWSHPCQSVSGNASNEFVPVAAVATLSQKEANSRERCASWQVSTDWLELADSPVGSARAKPYKIPPNCRGATRVKTSLMLEREKSLRKVAGFAFLSQGVHLLGSSWQIRAGTFEEDASWCPGPWELHSAAPSGKFRRVVFAV